MRRKVPWKPCLKGIVGWIQTPEIQGRKRSEAGMDSERQRSSTIRGQVFSFTPCSRAAAAQGAVPTSPGTPEILSFILDPLFLLLPLALGKEEPWPFVKPAVQALGFKPSIQNLSFQMHFSSPVFVGRRWAVKYTFINLSDAAAFQRKFPRFCFCFESRYLLLKTSFVVLVTF